MKHPHRDVNGSGRIIFRTCTKVPTSFGGADFSASSGWPSIRALAAAPPVDKYGPYTEGVIGEWSPSGDFLKINQVWHKADEVDLVEVLP